MNELLLEGYECITVILPFFITFATLSLLYKYKKIPYAKGRFVKLAALILYLFAVFHLTGAGTMYDLQRYGIRLNTDQINLLPFSRNIDYTAYFLNVILFVPFGFILPLIWPNKDKLKSIVFAGFFLSFLVEVSQLFNNRSTDIDDLLLNTLGAGLGWLLWSVWRRITKRAVHPVTHFRYEAAIYILAIFIGRFLLFDEFGLAKTLYNF